MMLTDKGLLIVLSGPSGAGKDSVIEEMKKNGADFNLSVSLTTRQKRCGEVDGESYYFVTREYFEKKLKEGGFLEFAEYGGNLYGTPKAPVDEALAAGRNVLLEIEVQGADKIRALYPDCVSIFILPPSVGVLEKRLRGRNTDDEEVIQRRLLIAKEEMRRSSDYSYVVINDSLQQAADDVASIIKAEKLKSARNKKTISEVIHHA